MVSSTFTHMFLYNFDDIKAGWSWASPSNLRKYLSLQTLKFWQNTETAKERLARKEADPNLDPHYKLMLRNLYPEVPTYWWGIVVVIAWALGLICLYEMDSTLPVSPAQFLISHCQPLISNLVVGFSRFYGFDVLVYAVLRRTDGYHWFPVQYPADLPNACWIHVQGPPPCQHVLHMLHLQRLAE